MLFCFVLLQSLVVQFSMTDLLPPALADSFVIISHPFAFVNTFFRTFFNIFYFLFFNAFSFRLPSNPHSIWLCQSFSFSVFFAASRTRLDYIITFSSLCQPFFSSFLKNFLNCKTSVKSNNLTRQKAAFFC